MPEMDRWTGRQTNRVTEMKQRRRQRTLTIAKFLLSFLLTAPSALCGGFHGHAEVRHLTSLPLLQVCQAPLAWCLWDLLQVCNTKTRTVQHQDQHGATPRPAWCNTRPGMVQHHDQHGATPRPTQSNTQTCMVQHQDQHSATPRPAMCNTKTGTVQHQDH